MVPEERGDPNESLVRIRSVTFHSQAARRGHCLASLSDSLISLPWLDPREKERERESVRLLSFCFHLITDVKGLRTPTPLSLPPPRPPQGWPPTFSPRSTCLYYSFIYSNYLHDVNLSLPLISLPSRALSTATPLLVDELLARRDC